MPIPNSLTLILRRIFPFFLIHLIRPFNKLTPWNSRLPTFIQPICRNFRNIISPVSLHGFVILVAVFTFKSVFISTCSRRV